MTVVYILLAIFLSGMVCLHLLFCLAGVIGAVKGYSSIEGGVVMTVVCFILACLWGAGLAYVIWKLAY